MTTPPVLQCIPFPKTLELTGDNNGQVWKHFSQVWKNYEVASNLKKQPQDIRVATLLTCFGESALEIYNGLKIDHKKETVEKILEKFEEYCVGKPNEIYERYIFNSRSQEPHESFDYFLSSLITLSKNCNYGALKDDLIRDRIVMGINDSATRKRLLQDDKLSLSKCINVVKASESAERQRKAIEEKAEVEVNKISGGDRRQKRQQFVNMPPQCPMVDNCFFCGGRHPKKKEKCPAWGQVCTNCKKMNHLATKCTFRFSKENMKKCTRKKKLYVLESDDDDDDEQHNEVLAVEANMHKVTTESAYKSKLYATMQIRMRRTKFQLDSGATVNVLPEKEYVRLTGDSTFHDLQPTDVTLVMFNKTKLKPRGHCILKVKNPKNGKRYRVDFQITPSAITKPILGARAVQHMHLITVNKENILNVDRSYSENVPQIVNQYPDVFRGLGNLPGELTLTVDRSIQPVQLPPRKLPLAIENDVKTHLDELVEEGIITPVHEPTDWISAMVVVKKSNGKIRLCIDPKPLNKALKRNHYPMPIIDDILPKLNKAQFFTVVDAKNGFWHVKLSEESSYLTTFSTPFQRYRWLRMPFGISPAPEEFQRRLHQALDGLQGVAAVADDILVYGDSEQSHDKHLENLLQRCQTMGIVLNEEKMNYKKKSVKFLGHYLGVDGVKADPEKINAIVNMPRPVDKKAVQRILGMANYLQKFCPQLSHITAPMRDLVKSDIHFIWDDPQEKSFEAMKRLISNRPVLKYFDRDEDVVLQCDASERGLGACLLQQGQPVAYASRSLTDAEANYAQIEKELLAIVFGTERFEHYVYGRKVKVETDHKPLEVILKKSLLTAPKRLQRMMLRLQKYDLEVFYKKGTEMYLADTLSRAYEMSTNGDKQLDEVLQVSDLEKELEDINVLQSIPMPPEKLKRFQEETLRDPELQTLMQVVNKGWPESKRELPLEIQAYFTYRDEIVHQSGLLLKGDRIIIPKNLRRETLEYIHSSHLGAEGCLQRARECVFWPNMSTELQQWIARCGICRQMEITPPNETLQSHEIPGRPWAKVGVDLFQVNGLNYMVTVDYYSNFWEIDKLDKTDALVVIKKLKAHFARYGVPDKVVTDNGPQFSCHKFYQFSQAWEFSHIKTSPYHSQANGKAESAVKTAKRLIQKAALSKHYIYMSLLDHRNTQTKGFSSSPVQRFMSRRTKTALPISEQKLKPKVIDARAEITASQRKQASYYNSNATDRHGFKVGDIVRIKPVQGKFWEKGKIEAEAGIRSYHVRTEKGRLIRRNSKYLKLTKEMFRPQDFDIAFDTEDAAPNQLVHAEVYREDAIEPPRIEMNAEHYVTRSGRVVNRPRRFIEEM